MVCPFKCYSCPLSQNQLYHIQLVILQWFSLYAKPPTYLLQRPMFHPSLPCFVSQETDLYGLDIGFLAPWHWRRLEGRRRLGLEGFLPNALFDLVMQLQRPHFQAVPLPLLQASPNLRTPVPSLCAYGQQQILTVAGPSVLLHSLLVFLPLPTSL